MSVHQSRLHSEAVSGSNLSVHQSRLNSEEDRVIKMIKY